MQFGHLYRSAGQAARVGGDFYDLAALDNHHITAMIGDVSGKGLTAAKLTFRVKDTLRAYVFAGDDPATAMSKCDHALAAYIAEAGFVSVFLGVLDTEEGRLLYCSAGHPPGLVVGVDGSVSELKTSSPVLCALRNARYVLEEANLGPRDLLVLYTDGLTEARQGTGFFGEERLLAYLKTVHKIPAAEVPKAIHREVVAFSGGPLSDDLAILALRLEHTQTEQSHPARRPPPATVEAPAR